jgi:hypothetical protein
MFYGWQITGRFDGGEEDEFIVATRTTELEEAVAVGLRQLVSAFITKAGPAMRAVEFEVTDARLLGPIANLP